jgi:small-conductance mechanosensitive channel
MPGVEDEEEPVDVAVPTVKGIFVRFFFSRHPIALALKLLIVATITIPLGIGLFLEFPSAHIGDISIPQLILYIGFSVLSVAVVAILLNLILRAILVTADENGSVGSALLFVSELQTFFAIVIAMSIFILMLNIQTPLTIKFFSHGNTRYRVNQVMICVVTATIVMAWKRHYMKRVAMQFNYSNYSERIQASLQDDRIIQSLSKAKGAYKFRSRFSRPVFSFMQSSSRPAHSTVHGGEVKPRRMSGDEGKATEVERSTPMTTAIKSLEEGDRPVSTPTSTDFINLEQPPQSEKPTTSKHAKSSKVISEAEKQRQFAAFSLLASRTLALFDASTGDYKAETLREARKVAARLFRWLKPLNRDYLIPNDLRSYLENDDFERAVVMFRGRRIANVAEMITENDLRRGIDNMLQERCGLAKSMQSIETALDKINLILTVVLGGILLIIFILVFTEGTSVLNGLTSLITAFSFIFGSTVTHLFESVIFLLVIHPFDVGDRVYIPLTTTGPLVPVGEGSLDNLIVVEMHVLSTIFERWDGIRVYVQNHILATKAIFNVRRSGPTRDYFRLQVAFDTPIERINILRKRLEAFVTREASDYGEYSLISIEYLENCNKLGLQVIILHRNNWQDMEAQLARRTKALMFLRSTLDELGINYSLPVQRVQLVGNVQPSVSVNSSTNTS